MRGVAGEDKKLGKRKVRMGNRERMSWHGVREGGREGDGIERDITRRRERNFGSRKRRGEEMVGRLRGWVNSARRWANSHG